MHTCTHIYTHTHTHLDDIFQQTPPQLLHLDVGGVLGTDDDGVDPEGNACSFVQLVLYSHLHRYQDTILKVERI